MAIGRGCARPSATAGRRWYRELHHITLQSESQPPQRHGDQHDCHARVGGFASSLAWLTNVVSRVSSHYLIGKDGTVCQLVADSDAAWHAGKSAWKGLTSQAIEDCSLGVELENANDGKDTYPAAQLKAAHDLCAQKIARYHISRDMVVRHLDIATPKGRKTDPAGFPWVPFVEGLYPMTPTPPPTAPPVMPLPIVQSYRVLGTPIFERQDLSGPVVGYLQPGEIVQVDVAYENGAFHLKDQRGFAALSNVQGPL